MQILSALDAISPAFSRTKLILFSPFRKGRTWKLAATAYLATAGTAFFPFQLIYLAFIPMARRAAGPWTTWAILGGVLLFTALFLYIFYLCSRVRFAFFDIALNRGQFVAPAWRKYGPQARKWTLFKVALGTLITLAMAAPILAYSREMFTFFTSLNFKPGEPPPPEFMATVLTFYASFFLLYFVLGLFFFISSLLSDFIVPSLALEDTTLLEAFTRLGKLLRNEPGQLILYAVLKIGLGLGLYMGGMIAFELVFFIAFFLIALVAALIGFLLHLLHVPIIALIVLGALVAIAGYILLFYCMMILIGALFTFFEAYTLYFLGGRYPLLGDLLTASTPPPTYTPARAYPNFYPSPPPPTTE
jgi:hypothetical protein